MTGSEKLTLSQKTLLLRSDSVSGLERFWMLLNCTAREIRCTNGSMLCSFILYGWAKNAWWKTISLYVKRWLGGHSLTLQNKLILGTDANSSRCQIYKARQKKKEKKLLFSGVWTKETSNFCDFTVLQFILHTHRLPKDRESETKPLAFHKLHKNEWIHSYCPKIMNLERIRMHFPCCMLCFKRLLSLCGGKLF